MLALDVDDAVALVDRLLDSLLSTNADSGRAGSDLRRAIGEAHAGAEAAIRSGSLGQLLQDCFTRARVAGASLPAMARVRAGLLAENVQASLCMTIVDAAVLLCLSCEASILAETTFNSREDIEAALLDTNAAFNAAEEAIADQKDVGSYRALLSLHASLTRHLVDRSRPLPRIVHFKFPAPMPALALANRIYGDAGRADELLAENKTIHPLFASGHGRALSA